MTSSIRSGGICVRATRAAMTCPARSSARTPERPPPYRPNGERIPSTRYAARVIEDVNHSRKLALRISAAYRRAMFALPDQELAEHEVSWLAIRQPAVIRMLERELASPDGDAFAAGLELACRV